MINTLAQFHGKADGSDCMEANTSKEINSELMINQKRRLLASSEKVNGNLRFNFQFFQQLRFIYRDIDIYCVLLVTDRELLFTAART